MSIFVYIYFDII